MTNNGRDRDRLDFYNTCITQSCIVFLRKIIKRKLLSCMLKVKVRIIYDILKISVI